MPGDRSIVSGNSTYQTPSYYSDPSETDSAAKAKSASYGPENRESAEVRSSILLSVKDALGLVPEYTPFDNAVIMHINTTLGILYQLGIGPSDRQYTITGKEEQWTDFISSQNDIEFVRSYMYMKVRMLFDPPTTATLYDAFGNQIKEMEWRLRVAGDENRLQSGIDELNGF